MELKEFIKQSIIEIAEAVEEANIYAKEKSLNLMVNPEHVYEADKDRRSYTMQDSEEEPNETRYLANIEFDVAVTTTGEVSGQAKAGIKIALFEIGANAGGVDTLKNVSRIKFTIPVGLPTTKYKK